MAYIKGSIGTKNKETNSKGYATNSIDKCTYKLFMGILKTKIEHHIKYIKDENEVQVGFTRNRRMSDNLIGLDYCVKESFKRKENYVDL